MWEYLPLLFFFCFRNASAVFVNVRNCFIWFRRGGGLSLRLWLCNIKFIAIAKVRVDVVESLGHPWKKCSTKSFLSSYMHIVKRTVTPSKTIVYRWYQEIGLSLVLPETVENQFHFIRTIYKDKLYALLYINDIWDRHFKHALKSM